jgi:hypothetical protein
MERPTPQSLVEAAGISISYANKILLEGEHRRVPPRPLAIHIFRATGWRHPSIADLPEEDMAAFEKHEPWTPPSQRQDEAA